MNLVLGQDTKKILAIFCLSIYILFSFLSNMGATLCLGTSLDRHIGIHALGFDSCSDGPNFNLTQKKSGILNCKNNFSHCHFQINLNKILFHRATTVAGAVLLSMCFFNVDAYEEKYNKIEWDIFSILGHHNQLKELKNIILII